MKFHLSAIIILLVCPFTAFAANPFLAPTEAVTCEQANPLLTGPGASPAQVAQALAEPPKPPDVDAIPVGATFLGKMNGQEVFYSNQDGRYHYKKASDAPAQSVQTGVEKTK